MLSPLAVLADRFRDTIDETLALSVHDLLNARFPQTCHARQALAAEAPSPSALAVAHKLPGDGQAWGHSRDSE